MGIYAIKPKFQQFLSPLGSFLIKHKVHPTYINFTGLLLSVAAGVVLLLAQDISRWWLIYVPFMSFVRTACNALDGMVARALRVKHQGFGEVLNEFFDRISDAAIFLGLALAPYTDIVLGVIATVLVLLNSYLSIVSKAAGGKRQYGGVMGKADRMVYLGLAAIVILVTGAWLVADILLAFIALGTLVTMMQRFANVKRELYDA